jgi:PCFT/HCP family folate transporter-like MFS transporter 1/3
MTAYGPLVPILVTVCATPFVLMIFLFIPETLPAATKAKKQSGKSYFADMKQQTRQALSELFRSFSMLKDPNLPLILVTFFTQNARFSGATAILAQYISKHFGWKLAETSLLLSPLGIVNLIVLVLLPKVSDLLTKRFGFGTFGKDVFLTLLSTVILIVAALIEGVSRHVGIFILGLFIGTFGAADSPLARATLSHYVEPEFTSRLYALIGMAEVLGTFIGAPVLAAFFHLGLQKKGIWTGMPWFYLGFLSLMAWLALAFVRPPVKDRRKNGSTVPEADGVGMAPEDPLRPE